MRNSVTRLSQADFSERHQSTQVLRAMDRTRDDEDHGTRDALRYVLFITGCVVAMSLGMYWFGPWATGY